MSHNRIRIICEAAVLMALAQILSYIKLYEFPNGGSIDCAMFRNEWLDLSTDGRSPLSGLPTWAVLYLAFLHLRNPSAGY